MKNHDHFPKKFKKSDVKKIDIFTDFNYEIFVIFLLSNFLNVIGRFRVHRLLASLTLKSDNSLSLIIVRQSSLSTQNERGTIRKQ